MQQLCYFFSLILLLSSCIGANEIKSRPQETNPGATMITVNQNKPMKSIYDFEVKGIDGKTIQLSQYKGKKMLIVNVASKCGYTPQYAELQKLHEQYGDKVAVLGFPANNFGAQEPGSNGEIASFCKVNYGVSFQLFEKISVVGEDQHPLYKWLSSKEENGWNDAAPKWNFSKYLIDEEGKLIKFYGSGVNPLSEEILSRIK